MKLSIAKEYKIGDYVKWSMKEDENHFNSYTGRLTCAKDKRLTKLLKDPRVKEIAGIDYVFFAVALPILNRHPRLAHFDEYNCLWFEEPSKEDLRGVS